MASVPDRILVVDDDPAARGAVESHLIHRGYEVLTAGSGQEALGILARQKICCMIAEVMNQRQIEEGARAELKIRGFGHQELLTTPPREQVDVLGPPDEVALKLGEDDFAAVKVAEQLVEPPRLSPKPCHATES
jgi:CheY-like chemotaxis protein